MHLEKKVYGEPLKLHHYTGVLIQIRVFVYVYHHTCVLMHIRIFVYVYHHTCVLINIRMLIYVYVCIWRRQYMASLGVHIIIQVCL